MPCSWINLISSLGEVFSSDLASGLSAAVELMAAS
jgi:hypothetical protein